MKFRAVSKNFEATQNILKSLIAAAKFSNNVVFCISPDYVNLITGFSYQYPFLAKCELSRQIVFEEYIFKGLSSEYNLIYFECRSNSLINVLNSLQSNMKRFKLKLLNGLNGRFVMEIIAEYPTYDTDRIISHQVYINMITRKNWKLFQNISIEPINVSIRFPQFKPLFQTVERLAMLGNYSIVSSKLQPGNKAYLAIKLCNDSMSIKSKFNLLDTNPIQQITNSQDLNTVYEVRIDIRVLSQIFLAISTIKNLIVYCKISADKAFIVNCFNDNLNFEFILSHFNE